MTAHSANASTRSLREAPAEGGTFFLPIFSSKSARIGNIPEFSNWESGPNHSNWNLGLPGTMINGAVQFHTPVRC